MSSRIRKKHNLTKCWMLVLFLEPLSSDWAAAPVLVRKKDGSMRWCIDYQALNEKTVKDCYPLPIIEDCLDKLQGTKYYATLDMASGYYQ